ncbi:MAG: PEP-CTERM sorting domain-containing protein [Candidatus Accumulibacter meliphilus]|jgi:hypothetical protein|uniref:PEP-CTERM sorting domain-containing protein n=1 Tax=Candidatus Accumulibacter meliphilus TaxID=2211374 RepID=A0A369XVY2_9PROT|nr:MAG: PEP-CTERM sorting domain-containing protein [Candidatus Accumulibacter meliphilus]
MKTMRMLKLAALSVALAASMGLAHSADCVNGVTAGLSTSDVTYGVNGPGSGPYVDANGCFGYMSGNDDNTDLNNAAVAAGWGNGFLQADKSDSAGSAIPLFGGTFTFTLVPSALSTSGTYTLSATDNNGASAPNFPINLDFVLVLKGGPGYAGWYFNDVGFDSSGGGAWAIQFLNPGNQIPALSHMSVYVREGDDGGGGGGNVPEPSALALASLALLGAYATRRRKV